MNKNFCVVTPNLNMGRYLKDTIESVLSNLSPGDEYFVIDGGSSDESIEIIKSYGGQITGWISEPDRGYADAVAKGLAKSNNEFQCWIGSGDLLLPGALDIARNELDSRDIDLLFGDDLFIDELSTVLQISNGGSSNLAEMMLCSLWSPLQDACFWRQSIYNKIGGINSNIRYAADYDLFLRMAAIGKSQYCPIVFSAFRRHEGQTSRLHMKRYKQEKMEARERLINSGFFDRKSSLLKYSFYWLFPRLRSRLMNGRKYSRNVTGRHVSSFSASKTKKFGASDAKI